MQKFRCPYFVPALHGGKETQFIRFTEQERFEMGLLTSKGYAMMQVQLSIQEAQLGRPLMTRQNSIIQSITLPTDKTLPSVQFSIMVVWT